VTSAQQVVLVVRGEGETMGSIVNSLRFTYVFILSRSHDLPPHP
jgi:hypothetical protein